MDGFVEVSEVLKSGVYALVYRGEVVYVGQSKCMLQRVATHRSQRGRNTPIWLPVKGITFDQVFVRPCRVEDLDVLEQAMIKRHAPKHNVRGCPDRAPTRLPEIIRRV